MSTQVSEKTARAAGTGVKATVTGHAAGELVSTQGKTSIADTVVAKIVGIAAREVPGVHAMGAGMSRALGTLRERIPGVTAPGVMQGVTVEVGERQTAADLDVIVEYGVSIPDLAAGVRRSVISAVEQICGLEVTEVNITIGDIHVDGDDAGEPAGSRVE